MISSRLFPDISFIYAEGFNGELGCKDGTIPWMGSMPRDMEFFKDTTMLNSVLMGRRTAETIKLPLKGRTNLVITKGASFNNPMVITIDSLKGLTDHTQPNEEVFIIGGAELFKKAFDELEVKKIYRTIIHGEFPECDIFMPKLDLNSFKIVEQTDHAPDDKNKYGCTISVLNRS